MRNGVLLGVLALFLHLPVAFADPPETGAVPQEEYSRTLRTLFSTVANLKRALAAAGVKYDTDAFDRVQKKLEPQSQMEMRPLLAANLGVHNAGKSEWTNMVIGAVGANRVTKVSDVGGSTTIPVALFPVAFPDKHIPLLAGGFTVNRLVNATDATRPVTSPHLLWTKSPLVPEEIVVIDTPDVDSFHRENAVQTRSIIDISDLVTVLITEQYANRDLISALQEVAAARKPAILIFSRGELEYQRQIWPKRIAEIKKVTGIEVLDAFVVPNDPQRAAKEELLDLYRIGPEGAQTPEKIQPLEAIRNLRVADIRIKSELGALMQALNAPGGLEEFLTTAQQTADALSGLQALFERGKQEKEEDKDKGPQWPDMPVGALGNAVVDAWATKHRTWMTTAMRTVPYVFTQFFGAAYKYKVKVGLEEQEQEYRRKEFIFLRDQVISVVLQGLEDLDKSGKISGRLADVVAEKIKPVNVSKMQATLQQTHEKMRLVDAAMTKAIHEELEMLKNEHPVWYEVLRNGDSALALVELSMPVVAAVGGGWGAGYLLSLPYVSNFATSLASGYVQTGAAAAVWSGSNPMMAVGGEGARKFVFSRMLSRIAQKYANARLVWLMNWLKDGDGGPTSPPGYLHDFYAELLATANATSNEQLQPVRDAVSCARSVADRLSLFGFKLGRN